MTRSAVTLLSVILMRIALILGAFLVAPTGVFGQGQFLFNTHDPSAGNNIIFYFDGAPATGPDLFVQVFAGPDAAHLQPVTGTSTGPLPLNRPDNQRVQAAPGAALGEFVAPRTAAPGPDRSAK